MLRFLNKLKFSKTTAKHLLNTNHSDEMSSYFNNLRDLNFIDTSSISIGNHDSPKVNREAISRASKLKRRSTMHMMEFKSNAIETLIVRAFTSSIVAAECVPPESIEEQLGAKLVQILINNYSEIMRIPEDFLSNVKSREMKLEAREERKLATEKAAQPTHSIVEQPCPPADEVKARKKLMSGYCSKISLGEYEKQRLESSRPHLSSLLDGIIKDASLSEHEKMLHLKRFREMHPLVFDDNLKMKKALNVLGLNETISTSTAQKFDYEQQMLGGGGENNGGAEKKKVFLSNLTNSIKSKNLSSTLNQTTTFISNQMNTTSMAAAKSMGFQKFFKKKKENLI